MADPATELAKEFLEFNDYSVRKETKFQKNRKLVGTPSDIDIIATRPRGIRFNGLELRENIIGEVKNWSILKEEQLEKIYRDKFKFIDDYPDQSWKQLRRWVKSKRYDRVVFCFATTERVFEYAMEKHKIKVITAGFMIKDLARFFKGSDRRWTYYPEQYNYNMIRTIMCYLYSCHQWKDKLTLEDLVWIDPNEEPRYTNSFLKINSATIEELVYNQSNGEILHNLIRRSIREDQSWLKSQLKTNKSFWKYLTGK